MRFIYFPACSVGPIEISFRKDPKFRFYNKKDSEFFHYPYLLTSAGHSYKKDNYITDINFDFKKGILFGDSGGYQIATKKLTYSDDLRKQIFNWLENNSNLAANLDIPPVVSNKKNNVNIFNEALAISVKNFKYFSDNQSGKTRFLNVLHGRDVSSWDIWYNSVKDFKFDGWCIGGISVNKSLTIQSLFYLLMKGEFDNPSNKFFHLLGTSKPDVFIYLIYFSYLVEKLRGSKAFITSDSSSPSKATAFGTFYISHDFVSFKSLQYTNKFKMDEHIHSSAKVPCSCIICKDLKIKDYYQWNTNSYTLMTLHNLNLFIDYIENIKKIMSCEYDEMIYSYFPAKIVKNLKLIRKCFDSKNPVELLRQQGKNFQDTNINYSEMNEFF